MMGWFVAAIAMLVVVGAFIDGEPEGGCMMIVVTIALGLVLAVCAAAGEVG